MRDKAAPRTVPTMVGSWRAGPTFLILHVALGSRGDFQEFCPTAASCAGGGRPCARPGHQYRAPNRASGVRKRNTGPAGATRFDAAIIRGLGTFVRRERELAVLQHALADAHRF